MINVHLNVMNEYDKCVHLKSSFKMNMINVK